jgi:hypothetical protein
MYKYDRLLFTLLGREDKFKIEIPGIYQVYRDHSEKVYTYDIKEGDEFYYDRGNMMTCPDWTKIKITYVRSGVIFFVDLYRPYEKEQYLSLNSFWVQAGGIQPIRYEVDKEEYPQEYYEITGICPLTEIVYV